MNGVSFSLFVIDKRRAINNKYRIRESTLIISGLLGPFGALAGMEILRHKTRKLKFKSIYVFLIIHLILIFYVVWNYII